MKFFGLMSYKYLLPKDVYGYEKNANAEIMWIVGTTSSI